MPEGVLELDISELFVSVQGEGPSTGQPAAFVRLGHCNLACSYCDTPYTWDFERFDEAAELSRVPVSAVADFLIERGPGRVVITGGEPLIQQKVLTRLLAEVDLRADALGSAIWPQTGGRLLVEVETNGTIRPTLGLAERVDQWNVSPKLSGSGEPVERRLRDTALAWFSAEPRAFFKFVVQSAADATEAAELVARLGVPGERVLLMPQAKDRAELEANEAAVATWAQQHHFGSTSRLHLKLWDGARGH
jgi:7-carboxy-7-deazaguanine synthase